jgi:ferredoxin
MPVIRFVREGRDVECYPGENLREVALREGIEIYGLKGKLGNCGGCGQCITCFVEVVDNLPAGSLTERTAAEEKKLLRRPPYLAAGLSGPGGEVRDGAHAPPGGSVPTRSHRGGSPFTALVGRPYRLAQRT